MRGLPRPSLIGASAVSIGRDLVFTATRHIPRDDSGLDWAHGELSFGVLDVPKVVQEGGLVLAQGSGLASGPIITAHQRWAQSGDESIDFRSNDARILTFRPVFALLCPSMATEWSFEWTLKPLDGVRR